jgi:hypothetical protein
VEEATLQGGGSGDTFRAEGRYRYAFGGKAYTGNRLGISAMGGSDNIDDWHHEVNAKLEAARAAGRPVTVWVNPDNPAESVFDREIRWSELLFLVPFSLAFGGVGVGALVAMVFVLKGKPGEGGAQQAVDRALGANARGGRNAGDATPRFLWIFAFFWNAMSWPIAILAVNDAVASGEWLGFIVLIFPLVGLGLLWGAVSTTWNAILERRRAADPARRVPPPRPPPGTFAAQAARAMFDPQGRAASLRPARTATVEIPASLAVVEERPGTLSVRYSRRRHLGMAVVLFVTGGIFTVVGVGIAAAEGLALGAAVAIAVGTAIDVWAVATLAGSLEVAVKGQALAVEKGGLFGRKSWQARRESIESLRPSVTHSVNGEPYFALHAHDRSGERIPVGDGIKGAALADALASRIAGALGLDASRVESAESHPHATASTGGA